MITLSLIFWFAVKHFLCDFPLQADPYQYRNKGIYCHPGGLLHAQIHALGTFLVLIPFTTAHNAVFFAGVDMLLHYNIDYAKVRLCQHWGLKPDNSEWYWILLGLDQLLHTLTYLGIIYWIVWS